MVRSVAVAVPHRQLRMPGFVWRATKPSNGLRAFSVLRSPSLMPSRASSQATPRPTLRRRSGPAHFHAPISQCLYRAEPVSWCTNSSRPSRRWTATNGMPKRPNPTKSKSVTPACAWNQCQSLTTRPALKMDGTGDHRGRSVDAAYINGRACRPPDPTLLQFTSYTTRLSTVRHVSLSNHSITRANSSPAPLLFAVSTATAQHLLRCRSSQCVVDRDL